MSKKDAQNSAKGRYIGMKGTKLIKGITVASALMFAAFCILPGTAMAKGPDHGFEKAMGHANEKAVDALAKAKDKSADHIPDGMPEGALSKPEKAEHEAPEKSNKGGAVRGKERAEMVRASHADSHGKPEDKGKPEHTGKPEKAEKPEHKGKPEKTGLERASERSGKDLPVMKGKNDDDGSGDADDTEDEETEEEEETPEGM